MRDYPGQLSRWITLCSELHVPFRVRGYMPRAEDGSVFRRRISYKLQDICITEAEEKELEHRFVFNMKSRTEMTKDELRFIMRAINFTDIDKVEDSSLDVYLGIRSATDFVVSRDCEEVNLDEQLEIVGRMKRHYRVYRNRMVVFVACARVFRKHIAENLSLPRSFVKSARDRGLVADAASVQSYDLRKLLSALSVNKRYTSPLRFRVAMALRVLVQFLLAVQTNTAFGDEIQKIGTDSGEQSVFPRALVVTTRPEIASGWLHNIKVRPEDIRKRKGVNEMTLRIKKIAEIFDCWSYTVYSLNICLVRSTTMVGDFVAYLENNLAKEIPPPPGHDRFHFGWLLTDTSARCNLLELVYFMKRTKSRSPYFVFDVSKEMEQYVATKLMEEANFDKPEDEKMSLDEALAAFPMHARLLF